VSRLPGRDVVARFARYTAGSVVALAVSEVTLVVCFATGWTSAATASVVAFFAGAIPNYVLNRSWVWKHRGPVEVRREIVPYVGISLATLGLAALATTLAARLAPAGSTASTAFVALAYLATYGILFVVKFFAYQRFVFRRPASPDVF